MKKDRISSYQTLMVLAAAFMAFWLLYRRDWLIWSGFGLLVAGLLSGWFADTVAFVWGKFGHVLGWINSRVILAIVFFLVLTPMAFLYRMFSKSDPLQLKKKKEGSYYTERNHLYAPSDLRKLW